MKKFVLKSVIVGAALFLSIPAFAADTTADIDCSVLSGTTYVCVRNNSKRIVSGITCTGFWGTSSLSLPGGSIRPSGTAVVDFNKGKCTNSLSVNFRSGNPHVFNGFDTSANTVLNISDE